MKSHKSYGFNSGGDVVYDRGFLVSIVQFRRLQYGDKYAVYVSARLLLVDQRRIHNFGHNAKIKIIEFRTFVWFGSCTCS